MWRVSVDYWDIMQEDKIDTPFGSVYTNNCNDQASTVCTRGTPVGGATLGPLQRSSPDVFINIGEQSVTGIDLGRELRHPVSAQVC